MFGMLTGTIVNVIAVLVGSSIGLLISWIGQRFSSGLSAKNIILGERLQAIITQGLALCTLYIGISGALDGHNPLITILSMAIGAVIGEIFNLDTAIQKLGDWVQKKTQKIITGASSSVSEAFVTASLLFCVGAMTIVGAMDSGLSGDHNTLFAKSMLDGIFSIVLCASMGIGVMASAAFVLVYQGALTLLASYVAPYLSTIVIDEISCVGSLLIIALSTNLLKITQIKVINLVPAMFVPIILCRFM